jgi:hypothetical protein
VARDDAGRKTNFLKTLVEKPDRLQLIADEITSNIAALGEPDDLTLVAFRPGEM